MRVKQNFTGHCNARIEQMLGARLITQIQEVIFHGQEPWWLRPLQTLHQQNSTRHLNTATTEHQACHFSKEFVLNLQISASWVETLKRAKVGIRQNFWMCHFASKTSLRVWRNLVQRRCHVSIDCVIWSSFHLLASMTSRPLLAMHALAKQLQPRMCYTLIHLDSLNKWGWQRLWTKPTNDASEISEWVTVTVLQYSLYLLLQLINEKGLWNMKPLQEFLLQCSETYWMHQIQPIWWLGAIKLNAMDWKAVHENNMKTVCKKSPIVEPSGCSR